VGCAETLVFFCVCFEDSSGSFGLPSITASFQTLSLLVPQNVSGRYWEPSRSGDSAVIYTHFCNVLGEIVNGWEIKLN
jgi:hypothetical protein